MDEVFVIMQIGNEEMDGVYDTSIEPAVQAAGFVPRRVDRHNRGDLLKSEIVTFIERSQVIVADLTNERPNCYLEVGYAMGLGKKANLILTAREDHHHSSPRYQRGGPKIHFDLEGYDILFWSQEDLPAFAAELANRIRRRAAIVRPTAAPAPDESPEWWLELRDHAVKGLAGVDRAAYMEVAAEVRPPGAWRQPQLLEVLRASSIHNFGWPIAVLLENRDEYRPRPTTDGIVAEIPIGDEEPNNFVADRRSYDYWKLFRDGRFYTLLSLFEDERKPGALFFEVRINRITETLLLLARIYRRLGVSDTDQVIVRLRHHGLAGRQLTAASPDRYLNPRDTTEDTVSTTLSTTLADLEDNLVRHVKTFIDPLFVVFDMFELSDEILEQLVNRFVSELR